MTGERSWQTTGGRAHLSGGDFPCKENNSEIEVNDGWFLLMFIYVLVDPRTNKIRYVGRAVNTKNRLKGHMHGKDGKHTRNWIEQLKRKGMKPRLLVVEIVSDENWRDAERKWIAYYRANGTRLTNIADGGGGVSGYRHSNRSKKKISNALKCKSHSEEWNRKNSEAHLGQRTWLGRHHSEKTKQKIGNANRGKKRTDAVRKKMSESRKGRVAWNKGIPSWWDSSKTEEQKKNLSIAMKKYFSEHPNPFKGRKHSPESIEKMRKARAKQIISRASIEKGIASRKGYRHSEETKRKISESNKRTKRGRKGMKDVSG